MKIFAAIFSTLILLLSITTAAEDDLEKFYRKNTIILTSIYGEPACYGFYWKPYIKYYHDPAITRSVYLSAGHCFASPFVRLDNRLDKFSYQAPTLMLIFFNTRNLPDVLIGNTVDFRQDPTYFKEFNREPVKKEIFFTNKNAAEWKKEAELQKLKFIEQDENGFWVFESESPVLLGTSGSPVITKKKEVAGILVAVSGINRSKAYAMPMRDVLKIYEKELQ